MAEIHEPSNKRAKIDKPKRELANYFSEMSVALNRIYPLEARRSKRGMKASILFGGEAFQARTGFKYKVLHVKKHFGERDNYYIKDRDFTFELNFQTNLFTMLVVNKEGEILFNSYDYETPEGVDWERGAFFDNVGYSIGKSPRRWFLGVDGGLLFRDDVCP